MLEAVLVSVLCAVVVAFVEAVVRDVAGVIRQRGSAPRGLTSAESPSFWEARGDSASLDLRSSPPDGAAGCGPA